MPIKVGEIIKEEWLNIIKDRRLFAVLFIIPLIYTAMFGFLYSSNKVTEISTVVFDNDNSQLSRQIVQAFDVTQTLQVTKYLHSELEIERALESGDARVGIMIPKDFSKHLKRGEDTPVLTLVDGSNMLISNAATRAANEVITTFSYGTAAKKLQQQGLRKEQVVSTFQTVPFRARILYNPTFNYKDFLVYGLIGAVLQQVLLLGIALTVTREKERDTWGRFEVWKESPWKIAYAKTAPYFLIGIFNSLTTVILAVYAFGLPYKGAVASALLLSVMFTFALLGIGYLISLFSGNQVGATQISMLIAVPSFLLSGFTWPMEAMPSFLNVAGHLLPLTYFLDGLRHVLVKGNGLEMIWRDCVALGLMGLITFFISFIVTSFRSFWNKKQENNVVISSNKEISM